jgi:membrane peptidoglycan carboxypeptidase
MYFNEIPYGGVAYGIEEAAQTYFGKSAKDLTLPEATLLAGLPSAPTKFSPYGAQPEYAVYRQHHALKRMLEDGYISQDEYQEVLNTKIKLNPPATEIKAPHFVMYVKDQLVERYGTRMVEEGGLEVYTSLDPEIQISAEEAVASEVDNLREMKVSNGAALVTNPQTGEILAMVGSSNYFDTESDGNVNVTLQQRQPGSSIKPVTYALALLNGMTPMSMINDSPVSYPDGDKLYQPVNYDNTFHGRVSLKTALGSSFNIPAVKLVDRFGVTEMIELGKAMGITTWEDRDRFGLSITLGGGEVKMTDMAVVYGVFANQGIRVDLHPILKVQDYSGRVLEEFKCEPNRDFLPEVEAKTLLEYCSPRSVLSPYVAYQITSMLADNNARIPGFGANSLLNIENHQVAVKTGTTDGKRDNWAIGYTQNQVVVVWVGNNDNSPMSSVASGITGATPIWRNITDSLLEDENTAISFAPPSGMVPVAICADNGLLPCDSCQVIRTEYFVPGTEPKWACK